ncbi:MAG: hypothetical protein LBG69_00345 [Zoogloeaceae bacterium]|jgi:hypothetical protein|nr:hypothetical protein [Zoogloeaceae bacterium]
MNAARHGTLSAKDKERAENTCAEEAMESATPLHSWQRDRGATEKRVWARRPGVIQAILTPRGTARRGATTLAAAFCVSFLLMSCATTEDFTESARAVSPRHLESVTSTDVQNLALGAFAYKLLQPSGGDLILTGLAYLVLDPFSPNWKIEETRIAEDTFALSLTLKRHASGGEGEAAQVFKRRAEFLRQTLGYDNFRILSYREGIYSHFIGAERFGEGQIQLLR